MYNIYHWAYVGCVCNATKNGFHTQMALVLTMCIAHTELIITNLKSSESFRKAKKKNKKKNQSLKNVQVLFDFGHIVSVIPECN